MRHMLILLAITAICAGCVSQNSTSLPATSLTIAPLTPTPIHAPETDLSTAYPTVLPNHEDSMELPEYLEMPCWHVPISVEDEVPQGWSRYINAKYCFTFTFPSDWTLVASPHFVALSKDAISLVIGFRKDGEKIAIQRTGVGSGEIETIGAIVFLGQEISKEFLVDEGKIQEVLFQYGTEILADDLVFTISGGNYAANYDSSIEDAILIFDKIVMSFHRIPSKR